MNRPGTFPLARLTPVLALCLLLHAAGPGGRSVKAFGAKGDGLSDDTAALERAFRDKKALELIFPAGRYKITRALKVSKDGLRITSEGGAAVLVSMGGNFAIETEADNVSVKGLTFEGAGLHGTGRLRSGMTLVNNRFQNTLGKDAIVFDGILTRSLIDGNTFFNIAPKDFLSVSYSSLGFPKCWTSNCDSPGTGIFVFGGLDQTSITNNTFDLIASDAVHIGWNYIAAPSQYFLTRNNNISYNRMSRVHRIGLEIQAIWSWPHCGVNGGEQCDPSVDFSTHTQIKGNYFHDPFMAYTNTYGYSLALWGDGQYVNNAAIENDPRNCMGHAGYGIEAMGNNVLLQGNVIASDYLPCGPQHGWYPIVYGSQRKGAVFTAQNNVICGDQASTQIFGTEPNSNGGKVNQHNHISNACGNAGALHRSEMSLWLAGGAQERWTLAAVSALPIKTVEFFVDGSGTAAAQEISDVNTHFSQDRKWLYHAELPATAASGTPGGGAHTVTAKVTDVSGTTKTVTEPASGAPRGTK